EKLEVAVSFAQSQAGDCTAQVNKGNVSRILPVLAHVALEYPNVRVFSPGQSHALLLDEVDVKGRVILADVPLDRDIRETHAREYICSDSNPQPVFPAHFRQGSGGRSGGLMEPSRTAILTPVPGHSSSWQPSRVLPTSGLGSARPIQPFEGERMSVLSCRFPRSYQLCREATLMLLNDVFERFVQDSPVSVMVRGLLENTLSPRFLDELFANAAELQYTRTLLFSSVVDLMGLVVNRIQPAVNSAYHARAKTIGVSLKSVYNKLDNLETGISAAMVGTTAERLETVVTTMGGALPPLLPGYRIKILDGNHLAATEHRIKELRTIRAGALPGQALVVLDPSLMLVTDVVLCEDGHAQER